ncbi:MAG: hypothetical protein QXO32_03065 [Candidatus Bathyarchaeia archaeon]
MSQLVEEAEKSVKEALMWLRKCEADPDGSSLRFKLWRVTESLDYAAMLISLHFHFTEFYPEVDLKQPTDQSSALRSVEEALNEALKHLKTDPRTGYKLLKNCLSTLRALRRMR